MHTCGATINGKNYDVAYLWDTQLDTVLDYKEELEILLGSKVGKKLKVVGKNNFFGVIYDRDGSALSSAQIAVVHSEILRKAGLRQANAIKDKNYFELYNVSYGLGNSLEALESQYAIIYKYLGKEVGKDLFIEKTDSGNYILIYRRRGDKKSTNTVARRHAKLLRKKKISASIARENNNEVISGESSFLDTEEGPPPAKRSVPKKIKKVSQIKTPSKKQAKSKVTSRDTSLEQQIEKYIKGLRKKGKISSDERTAWLVYDFTKDSHLVDINIGQPLQAASMIKPFVALAFFQKVKEGKLHYGPKSRRKMTAMIQRSSNEATNWIMRNAGGPASVQKTLKKSFGHLFKSINIVEYIPANGRTYRNRASARDYDKFLRSLWEKQLPSGKEIRRLMALPGRDRLYSGTPIPQGTLVYNKTGTTAHLCGDMGILVARGKNGRRYAYSIVGVIEKEKRPKNYSRWKMTRSNVIRKVSSIVYSKLKVDYNLL